MTQNILNNSLSQALLKSPACESMARLIRVINIPQRHILRTFGKEYGRETMTDKLEIAVPRDRQASFDPQLIEVSTPLQGEPAY
jgi:hypothetical protein